MATVPFTTDLEDPSTVVQGVHPEDPSPGPQDQATLPETWVWGAHQDLSIQWEDEEEPAHGEMKATVLARGVDFKYPLNDFFLFFLVNRRSSGVLSE